MAIGLMRKVKARFQRRQGAPITQPYYDLAKLFSKSTVTSSTSSWVFAIAPAVSLVCVAIAALLIPVFYPNALLATDFIVFIYVLAIPRFFISLSALDAGSSFGGLGASREMLFASLIEPVLFSVILFFSTYDSHVGLAALTSGLAVPWPAALLSPALWLCAAALLIAIMAETGRLPFDNPATHLELTMVHEAMILDNSGPQLALIEWASAARAFLLIGLFVKLFLPASSLLQLGLVDGAVATLVVMMLVAAFVAAIESNTPKVRLFKAADLLVFAALCALVAFAIRVLGFTDVGYAAMLAGAMLVSCIYFLFSATFKRRLEIYLIQSAVLALLLLDIVLAHGGTELYFQLAITVLIKVILVPYLMYRTFKAVARDSKIILNIDPVYMSAPVNTQGSLMLAAFLILLAFCVAAAMGIHSLLLAVAIAIIFMGGLIISVKAHVLLQLMGFLILENGIVLLPIALSLQVPLVGEATALFDTLTLIVIALVFVFKINGAIESLNSEKLDQLIEQK